MYQFLQLCLNSTLICFLYSTPDLDNLESRLLAGFQFLQLYKAPPPYRDALARPNSNSTPDLASQTFGPLRTTFNKPQVTSAPCGIFFLFHFVRFIYSKKIFF